MSKQPKTIVLPGKPLYRPFELREDFFKLFRKINTTYESCYLLESLGEQNYDSRYSVIGFQPLHVASAHQSILYLDQKSYTTENPYQALRHLFPQNILSRHYAGGLVGYLGYNTANYFETVLDLKSHVAFPVFEMGLHTDGLVHDKMTSETWYFCYDTDRFSELQQLASKEFPSQEKVRVVRKGYSCTKEKHASQVEAVKEEIRAGNTFQCQIGFRADYEIKGDTLSIYEKLRLVNPSPHMYYIRFGNRTILGASPELLYRQRQGEMETFPLAGTTKRGESEILDQDLVRQLLNDPKEIAEHNMLIDLHRNDIGRVAKFGTVKVRRFFDIKKFSHVQHISSEVVGIIRKEFDMFHGLSASFPAGTLSGAPKIESMRIIERIEQDPRGPYGGAIGHFGLNGDCTFAIPIRTLFISGNEAFTRASGGIVYDSTAENEYNEILNKLAAMEKTLEYFL